MNTPDAFLFDMDGLLLDSERVYLAQAVALLTPTGRDAKDISAFFMTMSGTSGAKAMHRLTEYLGSHDHAMSFNTDWHEAVTTELAENVQPKPTVRETLKVLADSGHRMGVVTSTHGHRARDHLKVAGLLHFFEQVTGGDEVSATKPDPAPYLEMAAALGVDPARCAAFEDSDPGITAAVKAGCRAAQVPDVRSPHVALPDLGQYVATDLWQAVAYLGGFGVSQNSM